MLGEEGRRFWVLTVDKFSVLPSLYHLHKLTGALPASEQK